MNRKEKYQYLRSIGFSSEMARKWRDRKIEKIETRNKDVILKSNPELKKEYNNYTVKVRYQFLRGMGLESRRARTFSKHRRIDVTSLKLHKNKIAKNKDYHELVNYVKNEYPKIYALSLEPDIKKYVKKYKNVENYGVYTKWGTLTRIHPYKHETFRLAERIREAFGCNEKQAFYILYLMYEYGQTMDQIFTIIETDPLWEIYEKEGQKIKRKKERR